MLFIDYQLKTNFDSCLAASAQLKHELDDSGASKRTQRDTLDHNCPSCFSYFEIFALGNVGVQINPTPLLELKSK